MRPSSCLRCSPQSSSALTLASAARSIGLRISRRPNFELPTPVTAALSFKSQFAICAPMVYNAITPARSRASVEKSLTHCPTALAGGARSAKTSSAFHSRREIEMATLNTVLGPIDASQIGDTMSHVHLTIDLMCWHMQPDSGPLRGLSESKITMHNLGQVRRNAMVVKDNLVQDDLELAMREAREYRIAGGTTVINCDLPGIGRDVANLQKISRATGINIVASTGWYVQASHSAGGCQQEYRG